MTHILTLALALALDATFGEARWLRMGLPHPIVMIGRVVSFLEKQLNFQPEHSALSMINGLLMLIFTVVPFVFCAWIIAGFLSALPFGFVIEAVIASWFLAHHSLMEHVLAVVKAHKESLDAARQSVGMIVGRDTSVLDAHGVNRAAIESAAENYSDGVIAPVFWFLLLGLPGLVFYKCVNTLDSMIGYRSERYLYFGRLAARLDDVVNFIPARLTGWMIWVIAQSTGRGFALRDLGHHASHHKSPNAGWPEAAIALTLGLKLAGPRLYAHGLVEEPYIGTGTAEATTHHIMDTTNLLNRVWWALLTVLCVALAISLVHELLHA